MTKAGNPGGAGPVRIVVIDDHQLVREGLTEILSTEPDFEVVGQGDSGAVAIALTTELSPDVVLLDIEMPGHRPELTIPNIRAIRPSARIVILTMHDEPRLVRDLLGLGAHAYLVKRAGREELVGAIHAVLEDSDRTVVTVSRASLERLGGRSKALLTDRELQVLELAARALSNAQIAAQLFIAEGTVKRHLTHAYAKLGAVSRVDAINKAVAAHLISTTTASRGTGKRR
jgi:DNA-binding NarL/FixJ family response regulator